MARSLADVNARTIKQLAQAKWRSSDLTDSHARKLAFRALSAKEVKARGSRFHEAGALFIPYFDLDGRRTEFFRIRYLEKLPGAAGAAKNPQRYDQLPVLQEVYYPPLLKHSWRAIAKNKEVAVAITEGELKAACACAHGIPMMALGGVYSFMSGKRAIDLLPSMKEFVWRGRKVYIVYDNDIAHKPEVMSAQLRLSQRLLADGAEISYISIPPGPDKGVDDYIAKHGAKAFVELIDKAEPFLEGEALWQLNSEIVYVRGIDSVVERSTQMVMDTDRFVRHLYANRHYQQQVERGSGKNKHVVLEKQPLAKRWLEWEQRAELRGLTYEPGEERVVDGCWNMWNGWGVKPKRGVVDPWLRMMDFLFKRADKERQYFEQWCAYPIQHAGAKLFTAVVLWSRIKRIGKSLTALALSKIYGENAYTISTRQLKSQFNKWAQNRQFVVGEEIEATKDKMDVEYLKYIITSPTFPIRAMYKDEFEIPNHTNFLFLSNRPDALSLDDGDKRYFIHSVHQPRPAPKDFYDRFALWMENGGPSHLMHYLQEMSMRGFSPHAHAPETTSKEEMLLVGKTTAALWVQKLLEDPVSALRPLGQAVAEGCDLLTAEQLYHAFDPSDKHLARLGGAASLGKHLHAAGIHLVNGAIPVGTATGIHRLYAVRHQMEWDQRTRKEVRDHYNQFFSPKTMGGVK